MPEAIRYLHQFFEQQADIRPGAPALIGMKKSLRYQDVEDYTNQIAHFIREKGVSTGDMVGLFFNRSELPILAMLGILKAGAGYVPIDPAYPEDRIEHIITDASIKVILSEKEIRNETSIKFSGLMLLIDEEIEAIIKHSKKRIHPEEINLRENFLSYIIYTSGSTGKPKGVMTEHKNIVSFVQSFKKVCNMTHEDRVYQGFSFGFDGSVEEIWMAYANGAALITGHNDLSKFAAETVEYITKQKVTYFSTVPTFLSMIKEDLPTVKILVVSGEACPQELVDKWALDCRRMLNVYGPTEATVNTTAAECKSGKSVTIGKPLDGYDIFILDDHFQPVKDGDQGELYIGGPGLSRGYMNLPEMTAKAFLPRPSHLKTTSSRIYKTGDLVSLTNDNELNFYGRIDSQVKIRGYRIELSEIEAVLREHPFVHASAVKPFQHNGMTELAAFIVLSNGVTSIDSDAIIDLLKKKLPLYMIPTYLDILDILPTLTSGKTDRKRLPEPKNPLIKINRKIVEPQTQIECELVDIWKEIFKTSAVSIDDDFFMDLGGYSLLAAQMVSILRTKKNHEIAIRDIYKFSTIRKLAEHIEIMKVDTITNCSDFAKTTPKELSSQVFAKTPKLIKWSCIGLQAISLLIFFGSSSALVYLSILFYNVIQKGSLSALWIAVIAVSLFIGLYPAALVISILSKWIVIGKFKSGKYPLYSMYYFRWWLVSRIQRLNGSAFFSGTPLMSIYYRLMGARVGHHCMINTSQCTIFDNVSIGENTSIGFETQLPGYKVEDGMLIIGSINIGSNCFIGTQSSIGLNSSMGDNSILDDQSLLPDGETISSNESCKGSPARNASVQMPSISEISRKRHSFLLGLFSICCFYFIEAFLVVTALPSAYIFYLAFQRNDWLWWLSMIAIAIPLFEISFWVLLILLKKIIIGRIKPGIFPIFSVQYLRKWTIDSILNLSRLVTLPLYTTLYIIPLLRLLGIKIGARAELSVISQVSPDITELGSESFFADGSIIGGNILYKGYCEIAENKVGKRSFIGNSAVLQAGKHVGDNCLIGVLSVPPEAINQTPDNTEWLGSPSFNLPHRKKVEGFGDSVIYKPSKKLFVARLVIDALRISIPSCIEIAALVGLVVLTYLASKNYMGISLVLSFIAIGTSIVLGMIFSVAMVKNALIGKYEPVVKPLWSSYVWLNEVVNGVYESVAAPILSPLLGTPFVAMFLRMLGAKVGKNVFIETVLFGEYDLVEIDDYAALNVDSIVQNHLFEDRIFKSSKLKIGKDCSVGNMAVILYDTEMQQGSSISSLSLLMKGETVPPFSQWEGIPISNVTRKKTGEFDYANK